MQTAIAKRFQIRWMVRADLEEVVYIETLSYDEPWKKRDFLAALRDKSTIGMVAEFDRKIVGFCIYENHPHSIQPRNLAVHPFCRRQKIGTNLLRELRKKLTLRHRWRLECIVRETSLDAQLFLRSFGFRAERVLRGYFERPSEDAYEMTYHLED